ncbi:MAG: rRNA methyltransferase [Stenotrophomonas sp.]|nr:rRNA methyltransferase [Stenotrophomonas sp.]
MNNPWNNRRPSARPPRATPLPRTDAPAAPAARGNGDELRLFGVNAVLAAFNQRPQAVRKIYLLEGLIPRMQPLLKWCVANRIGYRVVEDGDLNKLSGTTHHEGVVADVQRAPVLELSQWLQQLPEGPVLALWLDGVGNPHNLGAILRSAAHFGAGGLLLAEGSTLGISGAAARVAEGGAEAVPLVQLPATAEAMAQLRQAGFTLAATLVDGGDNVFAAELPQRLVYVMGAEAEGMDRALAAACDLQVSIPGSGAVESLNVASATAVLLAQWARSRIA